MKKQSKPQEKYHKPKNPTPYKFPDGCYPEGLIAKCCYTENLSFWHERGEPPNVMRIKCELCGEWDPDLVGDS